MLIFKMVKIVLYDVDMWVGSASPKYDGEIKGNFQKSVFFFRHGFWGPNSDEQCLCSYLPKKPGSGYYFKIGKSLRELGIIQNIALY